MNTCKFSFSWTYAPNVVVSCKDDVCIPRAQPFTWLLSRLILTHGIPKFAESDFSDALQVFIEEEEKKFYDKSATQLYDEFLSDDSNGENIAADLETAVDERTTSRRQLESLADEDIFGQAYARIVQSATAMDLVQLEHSFAVAVETEITERKRALEDLQKMHVIHSTLMLYIQFMPGVTDTISCHQNVEETASLIAKGGSDEAVSELQRRFHADYEILKTQWDSRISELKELQRRNYRSFVMSVEEQLPQTLPRTSPSDASRRGTAPRFVMIAKPFCLLA
ncbi:unnamed protein product [Dibothriocephalus latus]|uniref:Uncharacterized protein n=1 Tax=Dibothriocephalus latus TaxID=60516 RepID=A0A3P6PQJ0_DIBLA|nr:unnamed protein product [Dibothriocephalus latus]